MANDPTPGGTRADLPIPRFQHSLQSRQQHDQNGMDATMVWHLPLHTDIHCGGKHCFESDWKRESDGQG